jgi:hypothetical protein
MCLLHTHPATTDFDREDINDFYLHNSDGIGVMWAENGVLRVIKALPRNDAEAWEFYQQHVRGKDCVVHWRMKTHGLIDLTNCHPYTVFDNDAVMPMCLMHNGVLATGNHNDVTKSDTWHYVQDYLVPILSHNPELFSNKAFVALLEAHIGTGNRFVLMNHLGETMIANERDFVEYKGALLSNTYAWSASRGGYGYNAYSYGGKSKRIVHDTYHSAWKHAYDDDTDWFATATPEEHMGMTTPEFFLMLKQTGYHKAWKALTHSDVSAAIDACDKETWAEFCALVNEGEYLSNAEIISCVQEVEDMYRTIYPEEYEDEPAWEDARLKVGML